MPRSSPMFSRPITRRTAGRLLPAVAAGLLAAALGLTSTQPATLPSDGVVWKVAGGLKFTEGPTWLPPKDASTPGEFIFSDIPASTVYRIPEPSPGATADPTPFFKPSGRANGSTRTRSGRIILCRHEARDVVELLPDGTPRVLAKEFDGKPLNSPNDVAEGPDGALYFTDPPYGLPKGTPSPIGFNGVYRLDANGTLTLASRQLEGPNGLVFSPDGSRLYIAESRKTAPGGPKVWVFDVLPGGALGEARPFYTVEVGVPDGMRVDPSGNLWTSTGDGIHQISPDGKLLRKIAVPEVPANLTFGGADGQTLLITARTGIYAVRIAPIIPR